MGLTSVVPLTEAAAFTLGCTLLHTRRFDAERVGVVLLAVAAALLLVLLIALTPEGVATSEEIAARLTASLPVSGGAGSSRAALGAVSVSPRRGAAGIPPV
ncbi:hypothetical protein [Methylobacterium sp. JK268]